MLIASYNPKVMGDILVVLTAPDTAAQTVSQKGDVVAVTDKKSGHLLGYNFLNASQILPRLKDENGQVNLTKEEVDQLNQAAQAAGMDQRLTFDPTPHFQVGYVEEVSDHPKSDHLHITKVNLGDHTQQIVCGSVNLRNHIKVVVANVGTMMPDGKIIWPGKLLGVESDGMICAARELALKNAPQKPGCLILDDDFAENGAAFDFKRGNQLFA
ncbi:YtpR family tRNA-binding protein [Limosilactobacillus secaliphilus]|uniref:tRNA-binding domain-containing protein n=1 Tax=Limosilactobacillus secaliphilus TaxID=396268 RepID=A0A0R2IB56_9LACO|nr:DUF4479 and tRNA-binding domain-containing protein [Limosilactobacillus secaliphilus]KRN59172.1 tRNA-binding domain-containing protein [Limosilactobacillus secaliphilus]